MSDFFHRLRQNFRETRGVSLMVTFGLTMVLVVIATGVTKLILGFMHTTKQVELANVAYSAAEGGIEMALYDLCAYKDGYETDSSVDFTGADFSGGEGDWRLFSQTLASSGEYFIPNPYFAGDRDGVLQPDEWGILTKSGPISLSLLIDDKPNETDLSVRFTYPLEDKAMKIIFDAGAGWKPDDFGNDPDAVGPRDKGDEAIITWTLSALDVNGEFTLQGVVWESDFVDDCGDGRSVCFAFDLNDDAVLIGGDGDAHAGEDINKNLKLSTDPNEPLYVSADDELNRVSSVKESFAYATPKEFIEDLNSAMADGFIPDWESAKLTINLIATLSETSGVTSNSLRYKLESAEPWADEFTYIISEGFAANIKQTIQTRFRRESAISIFSYVIFQ